MRIPSCLAIACVALLLGCGGGGDDDLGIDLPVSRPGADTDCDAVVDDRDNCAVVANTSQADCDSDGVGDACSTGDCEGDGVQDLDDNCPRAANSSQADGDADGVGAACDPDDADPAVPGP